MIIDPDNTAVIRLVAMSKSFRTGDVHVHAVRSVNLSISPGEFVAIMGSSGSGKSTLMNIIGCLDTPSDGRYEFNGADVRALPPRAVARLRNQQLGFVFQSFNLLARTTAVENAELPLLYTSPRPSSRERKDRAVEALTRVGLGSRLDHHPSQLSGGQQQRIAIARALIGRPRLVLADEPTGNLDTRTSLEIMALFQELNTAGMTIVMVTHEPDIAAFCGRVLVMRDGKLIRDTINVAPASALAALRKLDEETPEETI